MHDAWWFLLIIILLGLFWVAQGGPERYGLPELLTAPAIPGVSGGENADGHLAGNHVNNNNNNRITLSVGNARGADSAVEEYIVLSAPTSNRQPINITGWILRNGQDRRYSLSGGHLAVSPVKQVMIPSGANLLAPVGQSITGPILLNPGDRAYVITGRSSTAKSFKIRNSFRANKCLGFIETANRTDFIPSLNQACPRIEDAAGFELWPEECREIAKDFPRCADSRELEPKTNRWTGETEKIPSACQKLIAPHLGYANCVATYGRDADFSGRDWYVYLGQVWEMWADEREIISLFNSTGQLMAELKY